MKQPLYHSYDPVAERATEITTDPDTGHLVFVHSQNTRPILESAKRIASAADPSAAWRRNDLVHVARIPMPEWIRISRLGITKDQKAFNAYLNMRECRFFRTDDGRKL